jgi:hypothetical protein
LDKTRENNLKYQEQGEQLKKLFDTNEDIFMEIKKQNLQIKQMKAKTFLKKCMVKFVAVMLTIINVILLITNVFGATDLF